jgi:hypothetical protein
MLKEAKRDVDKIATEVTEMMYEFKDHKDKTIRDSSSLASGLEAETMISRIESMDIYNKLNELINSVTGNDTHLKEKMEKLLNEPEDVK